MNKAQSFQRINRRVCVASCVAYMQARYTMSHVCDMARPNFGSCERVCEAATERVYVCVFGACKDDSYVCNFF